jgi:prolipoprotein diacylglyceryltransferase
MKKIAGMAIIMLFAGANLIWKFSTGNFESMSRDRLINVTASLVLLILGAIVIGRLAYVLRKQSESFNTK